MDRKPVSVAAWIERTGRSRSGVYAAIKSGELESVTIDGKVYVIPPAGEPVAKKQRKPKPELTALITLNVAARYLGVTKRAITALTEQSVIRTVPVGTKTMLIGADVAKLNVAA
jgi:hypothetical protein